MFVTCGGYFFAEIYDRIKRPHYHYCEEDPNSPLSVLLLTDSSKKSLCCIIHHRLSSPIMTYCKTLALLLLLYSIFHLPQQLNAAETNKTGAELVHQTSPALSPVPGKSNLDSGDAKIDVKPSPTEKEDSGDAKSDVKPSPTEKEDSGDAKIDVKSLPTVKETCELVSNKCHDDVVNVTACVLPYAGNGPMELLVQNKGDGSLNFNVTVLPPAPIYNDNEVPGNEVRKMNVYANASITSSVVLTAVNWTCKIQLSVPVPVPVSVSVSVPVEMGYSFPSYAVYMTPVNGAYVLVATAFLIGIMWACCKLGKNKRHLDGVPYQELEMGQQQQSTSSVDVETATAWDQDWDDDWDDEKAVRSPSGSRVGNRRANGGSSRFAESNGWEDD